MPSIDKETIERVTQKFGKNIDLTANPEILEEILKEIREDPSSVIFQKPYGKTYTKDGWYGKRYIQYDKTVEGIVGSPAVVEEFEREIDKMLVEKLRKTPYAH
jgi:hypothetical protein